MLLRISRIADIDAPQCECMHIVLKIAQDRIKLLFLHEQIIVNIRVYDISEMLHLRIVSPQVIRSNVSIQLIGVLLIPRTVVGGHTF